jgi:predicted nucleotidyltransferase
MDQKSILTDTPTNLIRKYRQVLMANGIPIEKIILFGSYAKGTAKPWSDLDVCVVSPIFGKDGHDEMVRLMKLTSSVDDMIEPHPYNPKDLADPWDPLAHEIMMHGKVII